MPRLSSPAAPEQVPFAVRQIVILSPLGLVLRFINSATYSPEFPFALSLSKCGRSWFDGLTTTGYGYVLVFMKDRT